MARLPSELLLHIIDSLIPANPPVAFPPSHAVTRTLLSLCLVSRTIHHAAVRHLFAHCTYIDSPDRLRLLQQTLLAHDDGRAFGYSTLPQHRDETRDHEARHLSKLPRNEPPAPPPPPLIKSLFLSPFPPTTISVPSTASSILTLFTTLGPYLTRLVIDIPLRSLYPEDDHEHKPQIRPTLLAAFEKLTALTEFTSTRDELFLAVLSAADADEGRTWRDLRETAVWASSWPKLQRLALYNVDVSTSAFLRDVQRCRNLTHLVLTRADGLAERIPSSSPSLSPPSSTSTAPELSSLPPRLQRVLVVNTAPSHARRRAFWRRRWKDCFLGTVWNLALTPRRGSEAADALQVVRIDVPVCAGCWTEDGEEDDPIEWCQEWVRDAAIQGTLWDAAGAAVLVVKPDLNAEDFVRGVGVGVGVGVSWQPASLLDGPAGVDSESE